MVDIPRPSDRQDTREHTDVLHGLANVLTGQVAASPTINGAMAINGPLTWTTDNTYDVGASGANRPRDLFLGRNATIGGTLGVTGGQIAFPATQNASAGANTLDDYEEGSWTPSVGGTATYTAQTAGYIKVGRVVHVWMDLTINAIGTGSTSTISGLPFAADVGGSGVVDLWVSLAINVTEINVVANTSSQLVLVGASAAAASAGTALVLQNSSRIRCQCTYRTANCGGTVSIRIIATVDQVTAGANGDVSIRFVRTVTDDALPPEHAVLAQGYHRATVTATDAYEAVMAVVLAHLGAMGWPEIGADDLARAERIARVARAEAASATAQRQVRADISR